MTLPGGQSVVIRRQEHFRGHRALRPFGWHYTCAGPDGGHYENTSIGELRRVLRRAYPGVKIIEPWKAQ